MSLSNVDMLVKKGETIHGIFRKKNHRLPFTFVGPNSTHYRLIHGTVRFGFGNYEESLQNVIGVA